MSEKITLYDHKFGQEMGSVEMVIASPEEPDFEVCMILSSVYSSDEGVIFTVEMERDQYQEMCDDWNVETMEGAIISTFGDQINVEEVPEEPPLQLAEPPKKRSKLRVLQTPNMWRHAWGRCCCVKRGDEYVAVTPEAIQAGEVPWWKSPCSPFQLDLIEAAHDPDNKAMHVLVDDDLLCGRCNHHVWLVFDEEVPEELPEPPKFVEVPDPLCSDCKALSEIAWATKMEAWEIFYSDEHNCSVIDRSNLAVARANQRKRFSQEKYFEPLNRMSNLGKNVYTVKNAFYASLGRARSGTWADLDLGMLRLVKGLEDVDIPAEILDLVELDDEEATNELHEKAEGRAAKTTVDEEAKVLEFMLDQEAQGDDDELAGVDINDIPDIEEATAPPTPPKDDLDDLDFNLFTGSPEQATSPEDEPASQVREPSRQRPKAVPRVHKAARAEPTRPQAKPAVKPKPTSPTYPQAKKGAEKLAVIAACNQLAEALATFVKILESEDEEEEDSSNSQQRSTGG
jgi:hypothetical protein